MPAFLIPARNTRHRTACFALYKALLRQGVRVPLPDEVATGFGPVNPIKHLIRATFRRNKRDTSPRLVVCALQNGYKFLDLLAAAQSPSTPQHASILSFLNTRLAARQSATPQSTRQQRRQQPTPELHPDRVPLLTLVSPATNHKPPVYTSTARPLPLEKLSGGVRKVPQLIETSGFPFLRIGKPMSRGHSRVLRQKVERRQARSAEMLELQGQGKAEAKLEDEWEEAMEKLLPSRERQRSREPPGNTYVESVWKNVNAIAEKLVIEHSDRLARAKAMWKIVEAETELAEEERRAREVEAQESGHSQPAAPKSRKRRVKAR